jgi:hypothetical protein
MFVKSELWCEILAWLSRLLAQHGMDIFGPLRFDLIQDFGLRFEWRVTTRSNLDRFGIMHHGQTGKFCLPLSAQSPILAPYYAAWNQLRLRAMAEQADADKIPI